MDNGAELPRDFDALRNLILKRRDILPKRLAQIAAYALSNPDEIAFGTAASIANTAGVQPSTLIRFAQHLGFDGFTSLQSVFRERLRERQISYEERLSALHGNTDGLSQNRAILNGFLAAASQSVETISRQLEDDVLDRSVDILAGAETIFLLHRRRSYQITAYMAYDFGKLKIRNQLIESTAGIDPEILSFATPADAAIAISFSPYASATIEHAATLAARNVPVVAITDSAFSPLAQSAKVWFEAAEGDFSGFRSLSGTMALAMALTVSVAERRRKL